MNWFKKAEPLRTITIVEVEKQSLVEETSELVSAVASLRGHQGFQWLVRKLKLQAARLESDLRNSRHKDIRDVEFLQSGIQWCNWLQQQVDIAHERYLNMRPATTPERMHIEDIESALELIGKPSATN